MDGMGFAIEGDAPRSLDMLACEQLTIHTPGAIQPHGAFVAFLPDSLIITHASANLGAITGLEAASALGKPLQTAFGELATQAITAAMRRADGDDALLSHLKAGGGGQMLHLRAFRSGRHVGVDIQPVRNEPMMAPVDTLLRSAMESFRLATRSVELCTLAAHCLKAMTAYDRVMVYRFAADGHGEVIAEAKQPHMEPYLGLHYPAADVPQVARQLVICQPVCPIPDTGYTPAPLLSDAASDDGTPFDLTLSALRSIAPVHRQYLINMGVAASLSVGLITQDKRGEPSLWGMIVFHGETPRIPGPELQAVLGMVGQIISLLLGSLEEAELYGALLGRTATLRSVANRMASPDYMLDGSADAVADLLALVDAGGALVHIGGAAVAIGRTPPADAAGRALALMRAHTGGNVMAVDDLGHRYPELADCFAEGSGALLVPLPGEAAILWFRPEKIRTVTWGGDPEHHTFVDPVTGRLSPRGSFAAWKQIERGRAHPWAPADLSIAREFRSLMEAELAARTSAALAQLSRYDQLTGLPNRRFLERRLADQDREAGQTALAFIDLDGFKAVNDTMGHQAGDALLTEVARRLLSSSGPESFVARLGGDEFVVLCHGVDSAGMGMLCEGIRQAIEAPYDIQGRPCHVAPSIGVAVAGRCGSLDLIRAADMAMYAAKQSGGNRVLFFKTAMFDQASQRFELEEDIRLALSRGDEFVLLYQPIYAVGGQARRLAGFEALVRWKHPVHGWLSPGTFIPLAEKSGLILPLGEWVLSAALRYGRALRHAYPEAGLRMNVNVSVLQIMHAGFCTGVADALVSEDYPAAALCLEVVESLLANGAAGLVLGLVRRLGVQVAIDDFGIGFSSLSYLRRLPVDTVKLDRSFLEDIEGDPGGPGFITAVVALAQAAGKKVVFEGIETDAQVDIAIRSNVDLVQGFYFAPPLSANAAMELVLQQRQLEAHRGKQTRSG